MLYHWRLGSRALFLQHVSKSGTGFALVATRRRSKVKVFVEIAHDVLQQAAKLVSLVMEKIVAHHQA